MFRFVVYLVMSLAVIACISTAPASAQSKPNIILILLDDLGYGDLSSYGATDINTPNVDKIGETGAIFRQFYTSSPFCSPSRAGLLTGRHQIRFGLNHVLFPETMLGLPESELTVAELLADAGYATGLIGKWHLGHHQGFRPLQHGFDEYYGVLYSNDMHSPPIMEGDEFIEFLGDQTYLTRDYNDRAVKFIEDNRDEPFFLMVSHTMPHVPVYASPQFQGSTERGPYGDTVAEIDDGVRKLYAALDQHNLTDNTIIMFLSDNGADSAMGPYGGSNGVLRGAKKTTFEGGMRVPFLISWPARIAAGVENQGIATALDILPTLMDAAEIPAPNDRAIDGVSLLEGLEQGATDTPTEEFAYYQMGGHLQAYRVGRYKLKLAHPGERHEFARAGLAVGYEAHPDLLFDLEADPGETTNLAAQMPDKVDEIKRAIARHQEQLGDVPPSIPHMGKPRQDHTGQNWQKNKLMLSK